MFFASPLAGFGIWMSKMDRRASGRDWRGYPARVPRPGPLGAEATLGAPANQLGKAFGNRGVARKARQPPPFEPSRLKANP